MRQDIRSNAVVLLSGGIDSSTALGIARAERHELYAISFDYNQKHRRELESAKMVAEAFGVKKHLVINFDLRDIGGSALTSEIEVPKGRIPSKQPAGKQNTPKSFATGQAECSRLRRPAEAGTQKINKKESPGSGLCVLSSGIPVTYVPARNTIFLSFALAWAEVLSAENIFIGANAIDYSGYPDCRPEYLRAFEDMANLATKASVEGKKRFIIRAPLISMKKSEIIKKGVELGLDHSLTWSCYDPQERQNTLQTTGGQAEHPEKLRNGAGRTQNTDKKKSLESGIYVPCGLCDSCRLRENGFIEAGMRDPLVLNI